MHHVTVHCRAAPLSSVVSALRNFTWSASIARSWSLAPTAGNATSAPPCEMKSLTLLKVFELNYVYQSANYEQELLSRFPSKWEGECAFSKSNSGDFRITLFLLRWMATLMKRFFMICGWISSKNFSSVNKCNNVTWLFDNISSNRVESALHLLFHFHRYLCDLKTVFRIQNRGNSQRWPWYTQRARNVGLFQETWF